MSDIKESAGTRQCVQPCVQTQSSRMIVSKDDAYRESAKNNDVTHLNML